MTQDLTSANFMLSDSEVYSVWSDSDYEDSTNNSSLPIVSTHKIMIAVAKALGYKSSQEGICEGICTMGMRAGILRNQDAFDFRIDSITQIFRKQALDKDPKGILAKDQHQLFNQHHPITRTLLKAVKSEIEKNKEFLSDVLAFYDGIELLQQGAFYPDLFEINSRPYVQDDIQSVEPIFTMLTQDSVPTTKLSEIARVCDVYLSFNDVLIHLNQLKEVFETSSITSPVGVKLGLIDHTITLVYDPQTNNWLLFDANHLPSFEVANDESLSSCLKKALNGYVEKSCSLTTNVYTLEKFQEPLKTNIKRFFLETQTSQITKEKLSFEDHNGNTWLHHAVTFGYTDLVASLVQSGVLIDKPNTRGFTPLQQSVNFRRADISKILLNSAQSDAWKSTPLLHQAVKNKDFDTLRLLLTLGAFDDVKDSEGNTALIVAVRCDHLQMIQELANSRSVSIPDSNGKYPLDQAMQSNNLKAAKILLKAGASLITKKSSKKHY